ncbi:regulator of chromosome condensation 1/beta-lactamase-inhibitor protein II [Aspergillus falconensis]
MPPKRGPSSRKDTAKAAAPLKRGRGQATKGTAPPSKRQRLLNQHTVPTTRLDVYVFGTNCAGELGLGDATKKTEIPRPVLNPKLSADDVGVVHIAVGGMHSAALTHDNRILTWGVNDDGALGRDTKQDPEDIKMRNAGDENSDEESEDEDEGNFNLKEATPLPVDAAHFLAGTVFTQLAATDSATFALTVGGLVYGWGTFTNESGKKQFLADITKERQLTPVLIPGLENVVQLATGAQHVLALTSNGTVLSWGRNAQQQLGRRRRVHNDPIHPLTPAQCALPSGIVDIAAGAYHSFAVHKSGAVYAWGSNNFGQTAIFASAGESGAAVQYPTKVQAFKRFARIKSISGGKDHSLAVTTEGQCLAWGRIDNKALGVDMKEVPASDIILDEHDRPRILKVPTAIGNIHGAIGLGIGTDHSFVITKDGRAYSWGFNAMHQTGQPGDDDVAQPTLLSNKHVDGKKLVLADAGGQFSIVAGEHEFRKL